jgi:hypothetical protein
LETIPEDIAECFISSLAREALIAHCCMSASFLVTQYNEVRVGVTQRKYIEGEGICQDKHVSNSTDHVSSNSGAQ